MILLAEFGRCPGGECRFDYWLRCNPKSWSEDVVVMTAAQIDMIAVKFSEVCSLCCRVRQ